MALVDVIQFEGDPTTLLWKSPIEDFNSSSQLIVDEAHEAIVMIEGRTEVFGAGRHTLDPQNYIGMNFIQRMATGGKTIFPCKVYFVNKVHAMDMLWGTPDKLQVLDPEYHLMLNLRLRGNLAFVVEQTKQFALKFSGLRDSFSNNQVVQQFRGIIVTAVTSQIAKLVNRNKIGYFAINEYLPDISQALMPYIGKQFDEYGIKLVKFNIETISSDNEDTSEFKSALSAATAKRLGSQAEADARKIQGYTWQDEQKSNILKALASNTGDIGSMLGIGIVNGNMTQPMNSVADFFGSSGQLFSGDSQSANIPPAGPSGIPGGADIGNGGAASGSLSGIPGMGGFNLEETGTNNAIPTPGASAPVDLQAAPAPSETAAAGQQNNGSQCPSCHQAVQAGWKACPFCGTSLVKPTCPNCSAEVQLTWKACPFCGSSL